jgi:hypothetical protein
MWTLNVKHEPSCLCHHEYQSHLKYEKSLQCVERPCLCQRYTPKIYIYDGKQDYATTKLVALLFRLPDKSPIKIKIGSGSPQLTLHVEREKDIYRFSAKHQGITARYTSSKCPLVTTYAVTLLKLKNLGLTGSALVKPVEFDIIKESV